MSDPVIDYKKEIADARNKSAIVGAMKYFYYISPIGYIMDRPKNRMARALTSAVFNK